MKLPASIFLLVALLLSSPCVCLGHTLWAPDSLSTDAHGFFSYEAVFTAGPGSAILASYSQSGQNVFPAGLVSDCFCDPEICTIQENDSLVIDVQGHLEDNNQPGLAIVSVVPCTSTSLQVETVILPLTPVPLVTPWGLVALVGVLASTGVLFLDRRRKAAGSRCCPLLQKGL